MEKEQKAQHQAKADSGNEEMHNEESEEVAQNQVLRVYRLNSLNKSHIDMTD
jgi:hypothetical protein